MSRGSGSGISSSSSGPKAYMPGVGQVAARVGGLLHEAGHHAVASTSTIPHSDGRGAPEHRERRDPRRSAVRRDELGAGRSR